jgi:type VI secretion system protein ImpE
VGWERIERLEFKPPKYVRDLLWRQAELSIRRGPDAVVYVPVLYPGSHRSDDPKLRLGRGTDWTGAADGPIAGVGQRTLLVGDSDRPILTIGRIAVSDNRATTTAAVE